MDIASEAHLLKLVKDTVPEIVKATSIHYLGNITTQASLIAIRNELKNSTSLIRYNTLRGLQNFSPESWITEAAPLLADKVKAVRIAAAYLFSTVPLRNIPEEYKHTFTIANEELKTYLLNQADFADGNVLIADHYLKQNDYTNAQRFYLRALNKDSLLNYARLNLSAVYSVTGKNEEALKTLKTAAVITPRNDLVYYNLGLLYVEMKDTLNSMKSFEKAVQLKTENPRVYYNFGLLLFDKQQKKKAGEMLQKALAINPDDKAINCHYIFKSESKVIKDQTSLIATVNIFLCIHLLRCSGPAKKVYASMIADRNRR